MTPPRGVFGLAPWVPDGPRVSFGAPSLERPGLDLAAATAMPAKDGHQEQARSDAVLPQHTGPRPGALTLLTPPQRGLILAIMQAERGGRGGDDLNILSGNFNGDTDAAAQLNTRINMLNAFTGEPQQT
jgi:hypothetical protein